MVSPQTKTSKIASDVTELIGNTPMLFLNKVTKASSAHSAQLHFVAAHHSSPGYVRKSNRMNICKQGCHARIAGKLETMEPCCSVKVGAGIVLC